MHHEGTDAISLNISKIAYSKMLQIPSFQCLFCQHLNIPDAEYCSSCDGQLNLQPCDRCGAVDLRTAKNCYKCHAVFPSSAAAGGDIRRAPALDDQARTYIKSRPSGFADSGVRDLHAPLAYSQPERHTISELIALETSATQFQSRRGTHIAVLTILISLITGATGAYLYGAHRAQAARAQEESQKVMDAAAARQPAEPTLNASGVDAAALAARPLPATDAETKTLQNPSVAEKCPPALATLGLCNPATQLEKP